MRLKNDERTKILGVELDDVSLEEADRLIIAHLKHGSEFATVFTPNSDIIERCRRDKSGSLLALYNSASLSVPDGIGVVKASRLLKTPLTERVAGIELAERLLQSAAEAQISVYFLGGADGIAEKAAKEMQRRTGKLQIVGTHGGYFEKCGDANDCVIADIAKSGAKLLFVCLGAPEQEKWISENAVLLAEAGVLCAVGLGGSFDVWSGKVKRAPRIVRSLGLEWLFRSLSSPKRIGRIGSVLSFSVAVFTTKLEIFFAVRKKKT